MSDTCSLAMVIRHADLPLWHAAFEHHTVCGPRRSKNNLLNYASKVLRTGGVLEISDAEANYGWETELERAAQLGAVFLGHHGPGSDYSGQQFVGWGGQYMCRAAIDGDLVTRYPPPDDERAAVQKFIHLRFLARKVLTFAEK